MVTRSSKGNNDSGMSKKGQVYIRNSERRKWAMLHSAFPYKQQSLKGGRGQRSTTRHPPLQTYEEDLCRLWGEGVVLHFQVVDQEERLSSPD